MGPLIDNTHGLGGVHCPRRGVAWRNPAAGWWVALRRPDMPTLSLDAAEPYSIQTDFQGGSMSQEKRNPGVSRNGERQEGSQWEAVKLTSQ